MRFLTFGLPVLSPVLLEEGDSDQAAVWVLVCWMGPTHHAIQDKPTNSNKCRCLGKVGLLATEAHTCTRTKHVLQEVKKANKRYPKVWVGYHITLFNCFVTAIS